MHSVFLLHSSGNNQREGNKIHHYYLMFLVLYLYNKHNLNEASKQPSKISPILTLDILQMKKLRLKSQSNLHCHLVSPCQRQDSNADFIPKSLSFLPLSLPTFKESKLLNYKILQKRHQFRSPTLTPNCLGANLSCMTYLSYLNLLCFS